MLKSLVNASFGGEIDAANAFYFVKGLWGAQCVHRALRELETGGERSEGFFFAGAKLAKIFIW